MFLIGPRDHGLETFALVSLISMSGIGHVFFAEINFFLASFTCHWTSVLYGAFSLLFSLTNSSMARIP